MELYPATTDAEAMAAADRWQTDWYYIGPSRFIADRMARAGGRAYVYLFSRSIHVPGGEKLGAYHAIEIPYVWDTLAAQTWVPRQPYDQELADTVSSAWVRFAATGDPNGGGMPTWPLYTSADEEATSSSATTSSGRARASASRSPTCTSSSSRRTSRRDVDAARYRESLLPGTSPAGGGSRRS